MKMRINPWILFYLGLIVAGAALLFYLFLGVAQSDREQMILVFLLTIAGGGLLGVGLIGLLVIGIRDLLRISLKK
jgi:hypothetical protein